MFKALSRTGLEPASPDAGLENYLSDRDFQKRKKRNSARPRSRRLSRKKDCFLLVRESQKLSFEKALL